jgi:nicotinamide phosphoribosyltransferase
MSDNLLLMTDSYKVSHARQYPPGTQHIYSYFESRGGEFAEVVFVGLQYIIKKYLTGQVVTEAKIAEAKDYYDKHLAPGLFNEEGWRYILEEYNGHLPIVIEAAPEGTVITTGNVMMAVENTDPKCFWLTNFLETLLVQAWYPSTTATISREMKKIINDALQISGTPADIAFKLHDFGCRGVSSMESAGIGGFGHLVNFMGTDTVPALVLAREYYGEDMAGFSIPAAEHSTITSWGRDGEIDAYRNMLAQFPMGLVAVVSDSYDIFNACAIWGDTLYDEVMGRDGTLVVRPDSGDPVFIVPAVLDELGKYFPVTVNDAGLKVLDSHVRVIQGDGITRDSLNGIIRSILASGWSLDNVAFGSGGGLLQSCNRDTQMFAFKCSHAIICGENVDVFKDPKTASWKKSKRGYLSLQKMADGSFKTTNMEEACIANETLETVFEDGVLIVETTLAEIRERAAL